jgi:ribose/xylose/arabinose/galactoside ABC-type transport system permease subunit
VIELFRKSSLVNVIGLVLAWIALFGFFCWKINGFGTLANVELIARQCTIVSMGALGMTLVIISGGIDLSIGSTVAFVTVAIALFLRAGHGPWPALLVGLLAGCLAGAVNGLLISRLKVGPFIVTLGTMLIVRGAAQGMANEQKVDAPLNWLSDLLDTLGKQDRWRIFPNGVWLMLAFAVLVAWVLRSTRFGRHVVAIGSNENAARLCGVPVERVKCFTYVLMGFFAGLAGLMQFSRLTVGDPTVANGLELNVIAAVVIGGASLSGGTGSVLGSLLGSFIMQTIQAGSSQWGLSNWVQQVVTGSIIIVAVGLDRLRVRKVT